MLTRVLTSKTVAVLSSLLVLVVGIWLGGHPRYLPDPVADVFVGGDDRRVVDEGLDAIHDKYYRPLGRGELSNASLKGAVEHLEDRFSRYLSPREYKLFNREIKNQFSGIGTGVRDVSAGLLVVGVYSKSPAAKAGILPGDVITAANDHKLAGLTADAAVALIKGPDGTSVTLRVRRGSKTLVKRVTRATISPPIVASKIANAGGKRVAYVVLATFGPETAHVEM